MSDDPHSPTTAGPTPEPTPTVPASEASWSQPAGTAWDAGEGGAGAAERPEVMVGAAFAGGLLAALIARKLFGGGGDD